MNDSTFQKLEAALGTGRLSRDTNLSVYTTMRTSAQAEAFFEAKSRDELMKAIEVARQNNIPFFVLGGGSNLALVSQVVKGLVIRNTYQSKKIIEEDKNTALVEISSGYVINRLVAELDSAGLSGFEYHMGLPGTLGGALYMNSKWTNPVCYTGDDLVYAHLLTKTGEIKKVDRDYFQFGYDQSILQQTGEIVLEATFRLKKMDPSVLKSRSKDALLYRSKTQPTGVHTSGCTFRNISPEVMKTHGLPTQSAGYLVDQAGFKGRKVGDYHVSTHHANFIINEGHGDPSDLKTLISEITRAVKEKFDIELTPEVVVV